MKLIEHDISSIEVMPQPNGSYYLGLIVANENYASMLYNSIQGIIKLKYDYFELSNVLLLNIHNINYDEVMRVNLGVDENTKALMKAIDDRVTMFVFAAFPNERYHANLYGQYIPVTV